MAVCMLNYLNPDGSLLPQGIYSDYGVTLDYRNTPRKKKKMIKRKLAKLIEISKIVESQIEKELKKTYNDPDFQNRSFFPRNKPLDYSSLYFAGIDGYD